MAYNTLKAKTWISEKPFREVSKLERCKFYIEIYFWLVKKGLFLFTCFLDFFYIVVVCGAARDP